MKQSLSLVRAVRRIASLGTRRPGGATGLRQGGRYGQEVRGTRAARRGVFRRQGRRLHPPQTRPLTSPRTRKTSPFSSSFTAAAGRSATRAAAASTRRSAASSPAAASAAVFPNYRLSPWVKHPEHVKDVARAFAWTNKNIAKYGGDPKRLFVGGHSAGGHLRRPAGDRRRSTSRPRGCRARTFAASSRSAASTASRTSSRSTGPGDGDEGLELKTNPFDFVFGKRPQDARGRLADLPRSAPACRLSCSSTPTWTCR